MSTRIPWFTITLSGIQVAAFLYDVCRLWSECGIAVGLFGPGIPDLCSDIVYSPWKRQEWWRHVTHCFAHDGWAHLVGNLMLNFIFGMPIERAYGSLQTGTLFFAGVLSASLGCSVLRPELAGAGGSAGLGALMAALLTMRDIKMRKTKLLAAYGIIEDVIRLILFGFNGVSESDMDLAKMVKGSDFLAHEIGIITGFLFGLYMIGYMEARSWKGILFRVSFAIWIMLFSAAIFMNIFHSEWFPPETAPSCKSICYFFEESTSPGKPADLWINIHKKILKELATTRKELHDIFNL